VCGVEGILHVTFMPDFIKTGELIETLKRTSSRASSRVIISAYNIGRREGQEISSILTQNTLHIHYITRICCLGVFWEIIAVSSENSNKYRHDVYTKSRAFNFTAASVYMGPG
jgi:hypothetical protein